MSWLDKLPLSIVMIIAIPLAVAPFPIHDTPHLIEKLQMLASGQLAEWIDIGDLLLHGLPFVVLLTKLGRLIARRRPVPAGS